jgi:hypothetical protein
MSRPAEDRAIVDAGLKARAFDSDPPLVCDEPGATYVCVRAGRVEQVWPITARGGVIPPACRPCAAQ